MLGHNTSDVTLCRCCFQLFLNSGDSGELLAYLFESCAESSSVLIVLGWPRGNGMRQFFNNNQMLCSNHLIPSTLLSFPHGPFNHCLEIELTYIPKFRQDNPDVRTVTEICRHKIIGNNVQYTVWPNGTIGKLFLQG